LPGGHNEFYTSSISASGIGAAAISTLPRIARAQSYPTKLVHIVVGFAAGSANDIVARLIGQSLSERLGQQFVVENRTGAGGSLATETVARAPPDGYTILLIDTSQAINTTLYENLKFDFIRDIAPVASIMRAPNVMVVHPSFPAKTVPEFITYAKTNPGKISMASAGVGGTSHIFGELFKIMAGVNLVHVPYRGQPPALTDLIGGQVQVDFATMPPSIEYIRTGQLRALAVTSAMRSEVVPNLPTIGDFLPGYEATALQGIGARRNTAPGIVEKLNKEINVILADPAMKAHLFSLGGTPLAGSPDDYGKLIAEETEKWGKVVRTANIKVR
jgi:tripartite-type tricarboxylate transporter receptor subunit TctC